jgi:hypothetical protein
MKILFMISALYFSSILSAQEEQKSYSLMAAIGIQTNNKAKNSYLRETEDDKEEYSSASGSELSLSYDYSLTDKWVTTSSGYMYINKEGGFTTRNQDVVLGNKEVRLVEEQTRYDEYQIGAIQTISYKIQTFKDRVIFRPFVGLGFSLNTLEAERELQTNRDKSTHFSKHNRYTLSSSKDSMQALETIGLRTDIKRFSIIFQGKMGQEIIKSKEERQDKQDGEGAIFDDHDYLFAQKEINSSIINLQIGYSF